MMTNLHFRTNAIFLFSWVLLFLLAPTDPVFAQAKEGSEMEDIGKVKKVDSILSEQFPPGSRHEAAMVPMRDGTKLATDMFIPPGKGPWPVILGRGYYGRFNSALNTKNAKNGDVVYICQDARGTYDSEGKGNVRIDTPVVEINDCSDTLDWIAAQGWCNGKIGMLGASGNGIGPCAAFLSKNPHLIISQGTISAPWHYYYWGFHNGVRRALYGWLSKTSIATPEWPKPTIPTYDLGHWKDVLTSAAKDNPVALVVTGGWYDISPEAILDVYSACSSKSRIFATISPGGHGGHCPFTWPQKPNSARVAAPDVYSVLVGKTPLPEKSQLAYFVMGNFRDPESPGNFYRVTETWPVPHTPVPYYFHADGSLSTTKPLEKDATLGYAYDPRDPSPSVGIKTSLNSGPHDQRPLKDRKDILRFVSAPLDSPLEVTGKILADLYIATDVKDTGFVVKLIDIQPDGYEMMIRESAIHARYAEEFQGRPAPLEAGKVYQLKMDLRSTAFILDKGHRLAVFVTSSSMPEYEVHPNTFETVMSYDNSPVAHQTIHLSSTHPSSITLPVITAAVPDKTAPQ